MLVPEQLVVEAREQKKKKQHWSAKLDLFAQGMGAGTSEACLATYPRVGKDHFGASCWRVSRCTYKGLPRFV